MAILALLRKNARLSNKEVAAAVDLAPSSVHDRIRRLFETGAIRGAHAETDPKAHGIGIEALLLIEFSRHRRGTIDGFMDAARQAPEVRAAHVVAGRFDVIVHVVARDAQHLKDIALDRFAAQAGILRIETSIIFASVTRHELPDLTGR